MSTIRRGPRPADQFVMVTNQFARDRQLSLAARGLGLWLLSHVDGWETTTVQLAKDEGIGRDKLRGYLRELEDAGYLRREPRRDDKGRVTGVDYEISCTPIPPEKPRSNQGLTVQGLADKGLVSGQHKKTTSKKTTPTQKNNPSGGTTAEAARPSLESPSPDESQEEPMPPPADAIALFDVPAPVKARKMESPSARTVVAAFVDSYRRHHSGADPVKRSISRVGRDAKATLEAGTASPEELTEAASRMGEGPYDNLAVALNIHRQKGQKRKGFTAGTPARLHTHPEQQAAAARVESEEYQQLLTDDDLVRWVARDPAEVSRWIVRYPDLEARFRDVA